MLSSGRVVHLPSSWGQWTAFLRLFIQPKIPKTKCVFWFCLWYWALGCKVVFGEQGIGPMNCSSPHAAWLNDAREQEMDYGIKALNDIWKFKSSVREFFIKMWKQVIKKEHYLRPLHLYSEESGCRYPMVQVISWKQESFSLKCESRYLRPLHLCSESGGIPWCKGWERQAMILPQTGSVSPFQNWSLEMDTVILCLWYFRVQSYTVSCIIIYCLVCRECLRTFRQLDSYLMWWWDSLAVLILPWTGSVSPAQTGLLAWIY